MGKTYTYFHDILLPVILHQPSVIYLKSINQKRLFARKRTTYFKRAVAKYNQKEKVSVHGIAKKLNITESSTSKHLKLLYDLGFVNFEDRPPEKFYFLKIKEIRELFRVYDKIVKKMKKES